MALSDQERIQWINNPRWIGYPRAQQILKKLDDLLHYPRQARMPSMLIIGRSNNGKTRLIQNFSQKHEAQENPQGDYIIAPVIYCQAPPTPSESGFYSAILGSLYERIPSASTEAKRKRVVDVLRGIGVKVLIIDELHNVLAGTSIKQQQFLNMIKFLSNELNISIVGCGTADLLRAVAVDEQIQNRFTPEILPVWKCNKEYRQLLMSFESILPLKKPSNLHNSELATKIHAISEGTIGETSLLLNAASSKAISSGEESITAEIINTCGYLSPSDRTALASRV